MNNIPNRQIICDVLMEEAAKNKDLVVLCSDSRGSASLASFAKTYPEQFVEVGIAEQSLVSVAAGMARCGKRPFAASPACFLSTRSMEQVKVDVAYSKTNVKLIGISGGISYGALGMTHHSAQDIAALASIPGMRVYLPSDRLQTAALMRELVLDEQPAYIRVGRNAVEDVYGEKQPFEMNRATVVQEGTDIAVIACGEMVRPAKDAAQTLQAEGISVAVLDMYCIKPLDQDAICHAAEQCKGIVTVEEHSIYGGLGSMVAQVVSAYCPKPITVLGLPDEPAVGGSSKEVLAHYGLNAVGIADAVRKMVRQ